MSVDLDVYGHKWNELEVLIKKANGENLIYFEQYRENRYELFRRITSV